MDLDLYLPSSVQEVIPAGILIFSRATCRFVYVNQYASKLFSYDRDTLKTINPSTLLFNGEPLKIWEVENDTRVVKFKTGKEHVLWGLISSKQIFDDDGSDMGIFHSVFDISRRKKAEDQLKQSKIKTRHLSKKLIHAQEAERKRIAVELHDGISSNIIAVRLILEKKLAEIGYEEEFSDILGMLKTISIETRRISRNLHPSVLEDIGLVPALKSVVGNFIQLRSDLNVQSKIDMDPKDIDTNVKLTLYRILQEALNNINRHSHADTVKIWCGYRNGYIELEISDNGCGFDVEHELNASEGMDTGLGIESMKERTENCNGFFLLTSAIGDGTKIEVRIPA